MNRGLILCVRKLYLDWDELFSEPVSMLYEMRIVQTSSSLGSFGSFMKGIVSREVVFDFSFGCFAKFLSAFTMR